jgi:hypothetical protein
MKSAIVAALLSVRQHFFRFMCGCSAGLLAAGIFGKHFFGVFLKARHSKSKFSGPRIHHRSSVALRYDAARR